MNVYHQQMGAAFHRLHPEIQRRFDFSTDNMIGVIGRGEMDHIWTGRGPALWVLKKLARRSILFPKQGRDVPFEIHNYPYTDDLGREAHSLNRIFHFPDGPQRFDGTVVFSEKKDHIVEYLGLDHSMLFEMGLECTPEGAIRFLSRRQYALPGRGRIPVPAFVRGDIDLVEWWDDAEQRFYLDLKVKSPLLGPLFGFTGWFTVEYIDFRGQSLPARFQPSRVCAQE